MVFIIFHVQGYIVCEVLYVWSENHTERMCGGSPMCRRVREHDESPKEKMSFWKGNHLIDFSLGVLCIISLSGIYFPLWSLRLLGAAGNMEMDLSLLVSLYFIKQLSINSILFMGFFQLNLVAGVLVQILSSIFAIYLFFRICSEWNTMKYTVFTVWFIKNKSSTKTF